MRIKPFKFDNSVLDALNMELILKYFPNLDSIQQERFARLQGLYEEWNERINVISRKDIGNLYEHHVLHSLAVAKVISFRPGTSLLDVGTGGGFPGIPLAILFPEVKFHCIDSIGKKIKVVNGVAQALGLENVKGEHIRVQDIRQSYDFVISRAVTAFPKFVAMSRKVVHHKQKNSLPNGILYLKGGEFEGELEGFRKKVTVYQFSDYFEESFFETKKLIHLPL